MTTVVRRINKNDHGNDKNDSTESFASIRGMCGYEKYYVRT